MRARSTGENDSYELGLVEDEDALVNGRSEAF